MSLRLACEFFDEKQLYGWRYALFMHNFSPKSGSVCL